MKICFLTALFIFSAVNSFSAVKIWDGGGADGNWTTAANWVSDVSPVYDDDLVFPAASARFMTNNDFSTTFFSFNSLTIEGGNYSVSGNTLRLTNGLQVNGGTQFLIITIQITNSQNFYAAQGSTASIFALFIGNGFTETTVLTLDGGGSFGISLIFGTGSLTKTGSGASRISSTGGYTGAIRLDDGSLVVDANIPGSTVSVSGGTIGGTTGLSGFGGSGTVGSTTVTSGVISAGTLPYQTGILNINNGLTFGANGNYACKIGGTTPGVNGHDQLNVTGIVSLGNARLEPLPLAFFRPAIGDSFIILRKDGTDEINGTFLNAPEGSTIAAPLSLAFRITYQGGDGNDIVLTSVNRPGFDFDGDGKTDISIFRPVDGAWYLQRSTSGLYGTLFGFGTDKIAPADYDGDGKTDIAVYRPETGIWYVFQSSDGTVAYYVFGLAEDLPTPGDYDGDGKADISVFRPSTGTWYRQNSSDGSFFGMQFGASEDKPTLGDFDGDGKADIAVFRPSTGAWYQVNSSDGSLFGEIFGFGTDVTVPADYDGDGKTDLAVFRPSNGFWYIKNSNGAVYTAYPFGLSDDIPAPGDFDGDGKADLSVFRPSDGNWYRMNSSDGSFAAFQFGTNGDKPTQAAFRY